MIERSKPACANGDDGAFMEPCQDGDYVDWEDFSNAFSAMKRLVASVGTTMIEEQAHEAQLLIERIEAT